MTTNVLIKNVSNDDNKNGTAACVKAIDRDGNTDATTLEDGQEIEVVVYPGRGVVLEEVDTSAPDPDAKVLTDEVAVADGAV